MRAFMRVFRSRNDQKAEYGSREIEYFFYRQDSVSWANCGVVPNPPPK
jgi:hypothetical protein